MEEFHKLTFSNLKPNIVNAIKQSCFKIDVRVYNIANEVSTIVTVRSMGNYTSEVGVDTSQDLSKIIDKTIKSTVGIDCDLSIIIKGLLLGAFRSCSFNRAEARKTIHLLMEEIFQYVFKYKGDVKQAIEGAFAGGIAIAMEFKLNVHEIINFTKEDILASATAIDPNFADLIKENLPNFDDA